MAFLIEIFQFPFWFASQTRILFELISFWCLSQNWSSNKTLLFVPIQIYCCKQTNEPTNICKLWPHLFLNCECMCVSSTSNTMFNSIFFSAWFLSWSLCHFSLASFFTSKMHNKSFTGRLKLFVLRARLTKKNTYVFTRNMSLVRARKNAFFWDEKRETNSYSCCVIHENMKCKVLTFPKQCKTTWFQIDRLLRLHFHIWMTIKSHAKKMQREFQAV